MSSTDVQPAATPTPDTSPHTAGDASAMTITGGHLVAKALKAEGIDVVFTLCGGHIIDIYDGCTDEGIAVVDVRHEQVAAHAADGWARLTGRPGCAVVTAGPGTTDAITGVANAWRAESPMLLIGGQAAVSQHRMGALQDLPHVDLMRPITKFASSVPTTERVADMISMAFREAYAGAPGPSFLEIPRDVLDRRILLSDAVIPRPGGYRMSPRSLGDSEAVGRLAGLLCRADRPVILLGSQVWTCRAADSARALVELLDLPTYLNGAARGTLPPSHPQHLQLTRRQAFADADLVVVVGTRFDFRLAYGRRFPASTRVAQIDLDYRTVGHNRDLDVGIVGDADTVLHAVLEAVAGDTERGRGARQRWLKALFSEETKLQEARLPRLESASKPIHPLRLAHEINRFLLPDSVFIGDGGDVVTFAGGVVQPHRPGQWMDPGPLGTLGVGVPFALAAKLARPGSDVVALFGDGSLSLTGWDFETMVRNRLPFVGVVGNNSSMNQIRYGQIQKYGAERGQIGNKLGDVHYGEFAQICGGYGEEVHDPQQIGPALQRARDSGLPALVNVWVDPDVFAPGTMNQTMYK